MGTISSHLHRLWSTSTTPRLRLSPRHRLSPRQLLSLNLNLSLHLSLKWSTSTPHLSLDLRPHGEDRPHLIAAAHVADHSTENNSFLKQRVLIRNFNFSSRDSSSRAAN